MRGTPGDTETENVYLYADDVRKTERQLIAASFAWNASSFCSNGILSHDTPLNAMQITQSFA
jgi:hypothetical protein